MLIFTAFHIAVGSNAAKVIATPEAGISAALYLSDVYKRQEYVLYGTYEPLSVTITHIINNKSGISFTSYSHTGLPVAVLAEGAGSEMFNGYYDNTDIYNKLADLLNIA